MALFSQSLNSILTPVLATALFSFAGIAASINEQREFSYMNLIEHWGSGIPRIIGKVRDAGLREPEFVSGEVDLRVNIYRGQINASGVNGVKSGMKLAAINDLVRVKSY